MTKAKRIFRSIIFCLGGIFLLGAAWSLYQRGFFVPWQNLGYPSGDYLSADKAVEILATDGRQIRVRTSGGHTRQTAVAWHNENQSFWWAGFWYPGDDEISGAAAADFGCPFGLLAPPRPRWFAQVADKVTFSSCRLYVGETQLRIILFEDGNIWVWAYEKYHVPAPIKVSTPVFAYPAPSTALPAPAGWSPDGSRLFVSDRGTAWVVQIESPR